MSRFLVHCVFIYHMKWITATIHHHEIQHCNSATWVLWLLSARASFYKSQSARSQLFDLFPCSGWCWFHDCTSSSCLQKCFFSIFFYKSSSCSCFLLRWLQSETVLWAVSAQTCDIATIDIAERLWSQRLWALAPKGWGENCFVDTDFDLGSKISLEWSTTSNIGKYLLIGGDSTTWPQNLVNFCLHCRDATDNLKQTII